MYNVQPQINTASSALRGVGKLLQAPRAIYVINLAEELVGFLDTRRSPDFGGFVDIGSLSENVFEMDILIFRNGQLLINTSGDVERIRHNKYLLRFPRLRENDIIQILFL